jgi:hypothetical protein
MLASNGIFKHLAFMLSSASALVWLYSLSCCFTSYLQKESEEIVPEYGTKLQPAHPQIKTWDFLLCYGLELKITVQSIRIDHKNVLHLKYLIVMTPSSFVELSLCISIYEEVILRGL